MLPTSGPYTARLLSLDLSSNRLTEIPDAFCKGMGGSLETLDLSSNSLSALPSSIARLTRLKSLSVRENLLTGDLLHLPCSNMLHTLMLGRNKLESIEMNDSFLASAVQLSVLDLSENKLKSLPEGIGALRSLKTLDASMNQHVTIPVGLGYIASLTRVAIEGNMLRAIRPAIRNAGAEKIKAYLRSRGPPHPQLPETALVGGGSDHEASERIDATLENIVSRSRRAHESGVLDCSGLNAPIFSLLSDPNNDAYCAIEQALTRSGASIFEIRLNANSLEGKLPDPFVRILLLSQQLQKLSVSNNCLSELSPVLSEASLVEISCEKNKISTKSLADTLCLN